MLFSVKVSENEKALIYKDEKFIDILSVGSHKIFPLFRKLRVEKISNVKNGINGIKAGILLTEFKDIVEQKFNVVNLNDSEIAFVFIDDKLSEVLSIGEVKLYFKELNISVQKVNVAQDCEVSKEHIKYIDLINSPALSVKKITVEPYERAFLYINGEFKKELSSGKHYFYTRLNEVEVKIVDTRVQELEVNNQELLSNDKVTIRCNLTMHYKIADAFKFLNSVSEPLEYLYKQLQFSAREHIGSLNLDSILSSQHTISKEILESFAKVCQNIGVELEGIFIKDIILPGDMREIFNQVIEASKRAEANNISRREETAATRSLLNTAKLMKDNPALARLKELEALEKITAKVGTLNVYGGLEQVMNGLVDLKG